MKKIPVNLRVFMFQQKLYILPLSVLPDWPCNFSSQSVICCIIYLYSYYYLFPTFFLDMLMLINEIITMTQNIESEPVTQWSSIIPQEKKKLKQMSFQLKFYHQYTFFRITFIQPPLFILWSSGSWKHVAHYMSTNFFQEHAALSFEVKVTYPEDRGHMFLQNVGTNLTNYMAS